MEWNIKKLISVGLSLFLMVCRMHPINAKIFSAKEAEKLILSRCPYGQRTCKFFFNRFRAFRDLAFAIRKYYLRLHFDFEHVNLTALKNTVFRGLLLQRYGESPWNGYESIFIFDSEDHRELLYNLDSLAQVYEDLKVRMEICRYLESGGENDAELEAAVKADVSLRSEIKAGVKFDKHEAKVIRELIYFETGV